MNNLLFAVRLVGGFTLHMKSLRVLALALLEFVAYLLVVPATIYDISEFALTFEACRGGNRHVSLPSKPSS